MAERQIREHHLTAVRKSAVAAADTRRESDKVKLGHHICIWFADEEHALVQEFAAARVTDCDPGVDRGKDTA